MAARVPVQTLSAPPVYCTGLNPAEFPGVPDHGEREDGTWPPEQQVLGTEPFDGRWFCPVCLEAIRHALTEIATEQLAKRHRS